MRTSTSILWISRSKNSWRSWLAKMHMLKGLMNKINYIKAEELCVFILRAIVKENPANNPLYYAPNVLLFWWNLIEMWRTIQTKFNFLGAFTSKIEKTITKIAWEYIESIDDEFQLRALVFERDYEGRDSLDLLSIHNITGIMDNKNMEKIALELWTSQFDVKGDFLTTSSAYRITVYDSFNSPRDIVADFFFLNWKYRSLENYEHHLYQFQVWKKSMRAKFFVEGLFITILTVIFQYYLMIATNDANTVYNSYTSYSGQTDATAQATAYTTFTTYATSFYSEMQISIYLCFISLSFPLRMILIMIFAAKSKRRFQLLNIVNILDLAIFAVFFTRIYYEFTYYRSGIDLNASDLTNGRKYYDNIFRYRDDKSMLSYLYSIGSAWLWLRIILLFRLTRFLGPLVKMIQNMMTDIFIFMVLFILQLVIFASIGTLLFSSISSYGSFYDALKTLFVVALGSFDFTTLSSNDKSQYLGDAYIFVVVIWDNILLLNLLIAILSSTYALLESKKVVLYINEILKLRNTLEYDKNCSALVSSFPPFNVISLLFAPLIIAIKNPVWINDILFHINYLPLLILLFAAFLACNILLLPVAYLKGIFVNLQQIWIQNHETTFPYKLLRFLIFLFFGLIILLLNLCSDWVAFFIHCYQYKMNYRKVFKSSNTVSKDAYFQLQVKFEKDHREGNDVINYPQMAIFIREKLKVMENIQALIFGQYVKTRTPATVEGCLNVINQYVLVKRILLSWSIRNGKHDYLYNEVMKNILRDMKISSKVADCINQASSISLGIVKKKTSDGQYLSKLFYINLAKLHVIIENAREKKLDFQSVKDAVEMVIYENLHLFTGKLKELGDNKLRRATNRISSTNLTSSYQVARLKSSITALINEAETAIMKK